MWAAILDFSRGGLQRAQRRMVKEALRRPRGCYKSAARLRIIRPMTLISIPANPIPEDVVTGTLKTPDGVSLRFARWAPPPGRKGTVCLFQGRAEFIEKYFETVRDLRARGFAVATLDWRGRGMSERALNNPRKGYVRDFFEYGIDLETFIRDVVLPDCPPPVFALAHSMGATVLIRSAFQGHRWFDRMVLLSPMIALPGLRQAATTRVSVKVMRVLGLGGSYVPGGDASVMMQEQDRYRMQVLAAFDAFVPGTAAFG